MSRDFFSVYMPVLKERLSHFYGEMNEPMTQKSSLVTGKQSVKYEKKKKMQKLTKGRNGKE